MDGANRKWIGTLGDGIYLITSDGLKEVAHYPTSNSPLLSDDITALAYDEENRQLFIASDGGVVIYHADDVTPAESFSDIHCYPNPLRPDYFGDIEIVGLMKDSDVSVTDVAGNLVWKTYTNDGFATWDGRGNDGKRVTPGVYIIHGVSESGSKGKTCKLLVL